MTQRTIKPFIVETYPKPPKKDFITNKTNVYHIDDSWILDVLDLKDYGPEKNKGFGYVLIVIDIFSILVGQFLSKIKMFKQ